ncbi:retrovirus-related pol polyprotein from transposon TNT 1-94, partial [Tanacetum coccineum]
MVNLPNGKRAIGTNYVFRNKKAERGIVVRNKVRLVAQGYAQEEGINYDKVFAHVARIEAIRLFLAYASFMGFIVYQMDVKSAFLYGTIEEEVYVCQPLGFEDLRFPEKVYKVYVDDIIFGSTKKSLCDEFEGLMHKRFQMSSMEELTFFLGLQIAGTPLETNKALIKDEEAEDVDVYLYRLMIGSLMYLTASRPDIM